ncbi:MAG: SRPBCC family protein [Jatrophihabitans sp.]|uniref:SRPBCC family protein n=1 Tax=Jatrophihabitans sp. TaxID=1932789 RepID=UPI003F822070
MPTIHRSVDIAAPADTVWRLLEDVRRLPEYSDSTEAVEDAPERLTAVGQQYTQVGTLLGMKLRSRWQVVDLDPGTRISSEGRLAPGVRYTLTQRLEARPDGGTRLAIDIDYTPPGGRLGRLAAKAGAEAKAGREAQAVLDGIKRTIERTSD